MKFGKTDTPELVDFTMPDDCISTKKILATGKKSPFDVYVGCAKWNKTELKNFYPKGVKDELAYYAQQFNSIELNSTFYNTPSAQQILKWKDKTPAHFKFFPKITNSISHYKRLLNVEKMTEDYCYVISNFEEKLGMVFLQVHENFSPREYDKLKTFIEQFPVGIPLTIELRHPDWFTGTQPWISYTKLLEKHGITNTIVDTPGRRDMMHMQLTTPTAFIRWVGCNNEAIDYKRLKDWVVRIKKWKTEGLNHLYFFVHQGTETSSPVFADYFIRHLNKALQLTIKPPTLPDSKQNKLF